MKCLKKEKIVAFINNELSDKQLHQIQTHITVCEKCKTKYQKMKSDINIIRIGISLTESPKVPERQPISIYNSNKKFSLSLNK